MTKRIFYTLTVLSCAPGWALPDTAASLLKRHGGFTDAQIAAVRRGDRVVRMLDTGDGAEVAFVAVSKLPVSHSTYMHRVRAGTLYKARDPILEVGRFGEVPSLADVKPLGPVVGETLLASIAAYRKNGVITFGSSAEPIDDFIPLAAKAAYLRERSPAAYDYLLRRTPHPAYFLWKRLTFGLRPVTRVAEVSVWEDRPGEAMVLMKQIYADRYFHSSFQIDHVIADGANVYLITLNYGRSSWLEGISGKMIRPIVVARTQAMAEKALAQAEHDFATERQSL